MKTLPNYSARLEPAAAPERREEKPVREYRTSDYMFAHEKRRAWSLGITALLLVVAIVSAGFIIDLNGGLNDVFADNSGPSMEWEFANELTTKFDGLGDVVARGIFSNAPGSTQLEAWRAYVFLGRTAAVYDPTGWAALGDGSEIEKAVTFLTNKLGRGLGWTDGELITVKEAKKLINDLYKVVSRP